MQGNGFKIFAVAAFVLLSLYYLFPTLQNYLNQRELAAMSEAEREAYQNEHYDDLQASRERALKLGLDLQGGMHVSLEVGMDALIAELAEGRRDEVFDRALAEAREQSRTSRESFVDLFVANVERLQPGTRLSRYFRAPDDGITARSENADVIAYLNAEADDALNRAVEIIRQRVDRFGVSEPSIQKQGNSRIVVELPGVDEPERVRDLLKGTARLEFRLMAEPSELQAAALRVYQHFEGEGTDADTSAVELDPTQPDTTAAQADTSAAPAADASAAGGADTAATDLQELFSEGDSDAADGGGARFTEIFRLYQTADQPIFGAVAVRDTAAVQAYLRRPEVRQMIPRGIELLYTSDPMSQNEDGQPVYFLLGVRERAELTGDVLTDARVNFDPFTNEPKVSLTMNAQGAQRWSQLTGANVGKHVAIVLDDVVYSFPVINERIPGGRTEISGNMTRDEVEDIVTVLKSGALPAPVNIVEERTVGPSLGAASIRAGTISMLVGLLAVLIFMVFWYRTAGLVADLALLLNILFIFGILAAFGAVLTLPGIAGIVLTIGMAVDANVLIFERIREELSTGKTLKAAIEGGYAKALSAIADGNITTFFVGVILYSFGVGPIQGFAVTLMAGILASLFSAIVITRLVFDWLIAGRRTSIAIG
ncbi:MAG TPA: protein translocase subunit SecD [Rubricoccaceae bacterium]|nr:protein translocase subunit SecD [Rubricoccaceae bacterium]